jgi:hypothetical protein
MRHGAGSLCRRRIPTLRLMPGQQSRAIISLLCASCTIQLGVTLNGLSRFVDSHRSRHSSWSRDSISSNWPFWIKTSPCMPVLERFRKWCRPEFYRYPTLSAEKRDAGPSTLHPSEQSSLAGDPDSLPLRQAQGQVAQDNRARKSIAKTTML